MDRSPDLEGEKEEEAEDGHGVRHVARREAEGVETLDNGETVIGRPGSMGPRAQLIDCSGLDARRHRHNDRVKPAAQHEEERDDDGQGDDGGGREVEGTDRFERVAERGVRQKGSLNILLEPNIAG